MSETKNLKVIREKIKHFRMLERKILKEDLDRDFGKITRKFFDEGFENYEEFKKELIAKANEYNYITEEKIEDKKDEVSGHQDKSPAN